MPTNTVLTPDMITKEALRVLHNNVRFCSTIDRQHDDSFAKDGAKIGASLRIRKPFRPTVGTTMSITTQDYVEEQDTLTVGTVRNVPLQFTSAELTLSLDMFSQRVIRPSASRLATAMDSDALSMYSKVWNSVGTPGTTPATPLVYLQAAAKLDHNACPRDGDRYVAIGPDANAASVDGFKGLFHASDRISSQYRNGMMAPFADAEFYMTQNIGSLTTGTRNTAYQTAEAAGVANGDTTLSVDTGTGTIKAGEVFTVAGINSVNPETGVDTGQPMQFVVRTDSAGGTVTLDIAPTIYVTGPRKNVSVDGSAGSWDNKVLTFMGSASTAYPQNLMYHKDAFTLATVDLELPRNMDMASRQSADGISLAFVRGFDITTRDFISRMDVFYGYLAQRPEWAVRIWG